MATENVNLGSGVPPEPLWSLQRRLYWSDRTWLLAHPDESMVRDYERGEFWPLEPALECLDDARRVRVSYAWGAGPGGPVRIRETDPPRDFAVTDAEDRFAWEYQAGPP